MKLNIKKFDVDMSLGNNGITIDVRDNPDDEFLGDLRIGRGGVEWCRGKTRKGVKVKWPDLIAWFESQARSRAKK